MTLPNPDTDPQWYEHHDALVLLTSYLADRSPSDAKDVAYAVEKPWKYEDEYKEALAEIAAEEAAAEAALARNQALRDVTRVTR